MTSMSRSRAHAFVTAVGVALTLGACGGDSPTGPAATTPPSSSTSAQPARPDPLARTFIDLAQQAAQAGDFQRASALNSALMALFYGVHPQVVNITRDGVASQYQALVVVDDVSGFVSSTSGSATPLRFYRLLAWQGPAAQHMLFVLTDTTSTQLGAASVHGSHLGTAFAADSGMAPERAVVGSAEILMGSLGANCAPVPSVAIGGLRFLCNAATFIVSVDVTTERQPARGQSDADAPRHRLTMARQPVSGVQIGLTTH